MKPYNRIKIGDMYQRSMSSVIWNVEDKDDDSKLIFIVPYSVKFGNPIKGGMWKPSRHSVFGYELIESIAE